MQNTNASLMHNILVCFVKYAGTKNMNMSVKVGPTQQVR